MGGCTEDDIVRGHRDRTLSLLWRIIMHCKVPLLVDTLALQQETAMILRTHHLAGRKTVSSGQHLCILSSY